MRIQVDVVEIERQVFSLDAVVLCAGGIRVISGYQTQFSSVQRELCDLLADNSVIERSSLHFILCRQIEPELDTEHALRRLRHF